jgi:hypothetical protein
MYRLLLELPFNVRLVLRDIFTDQTSAAVRRDTLPGGFIVIPAHDRRAENATEVPFKTAQTGDEK